MAESAISFLLKKLTNLAIHEASLFGKMDLQVKLLCKHLEWIRLFLREASGSRTSNRLTLWVDQMRDVCFDIEDIVDEYMVRVARLHHQRFKNFKVLRLYDEFMFAHGLNARVKNINITVDQIILDKERLVIENPWSLEDQSFFQEEDLPVIEKVRMDTDDHVGMHSDVECVKRMILNEETTVVSILGLCGLGKTTLARRVYNDGDVKKRFNFRAWVSIPQGSATGEVLMRVADSVMTLTDQRKRQVEERKLEKMVRKFLESRTCLIVLDELWSSQSWDVLSCYFHPSSYSKVLITSCKPVIPTSIKSTFHLIQPLSKAGRLELFLKRAFLVADTKSIIIPPDLKDLTMVMAEKCGSFPLTIALLGGLLARKQKTWKSWMRVLQKLERHENIENQSQGCDILRIVSFSFEDLRYYLKSCFLYCGLFPEDHEINARKLMNLWIAEGFLQNRGEETPEETAANYLEELVQRSMIQVGKRRLDGGVKFCYVHDMVRDFIISEATKTKFYEVRKRTNFTTPAINARRLAFHHHHINNNTFQCSNTSHLRSVICFSDCRQPKCLNSLIQGRKLLTVLDLGGLYGMEELPKKIGKLIHLKYLSLRGSGITRLPKSLGKLFNLLTLTLDLRDCPIKSIPHTIWKLHELRHLYGGKGVVLGSFMGVGQLTNLQILAIRWGGGCLNDGGSRKLRIREDPMWSLEKLPNLKILRLLSYSYVGEKMVCSSGGFPKLESLSLCGLMGLKDLIVEEGAMPELKSLKVEGCRQMKRLPRGLLRKLEQLKLKSMPHELIEDVRKKERIHGYDFHLIISPSIPQRPILRSDTCDAGFGKGIGDNFFTYLLLFLISVCFVISVSGFFLSNFIYLI